MQTVTINIEDSAMDKVLYILQNLPDIYIVANSKTTIKNDERWIYWRDDELDNFGKISIGLTKNDYDDKEEDYSKW